MIGGPGGNAPQTVSSMAQAEHLPIYKASYDLCLYLEKVVNRLAPRLLQK